MKKLFLVVAVALLVGAGCQTAVPPALPITTQQSATPTAVVAPVCIGEGMIVGNDVICCGNLEKVQVDHAAVICQAITGVKKQQGIMMVLNSDNTVSTMKGDMTWKDGTFITMTGVIKKPNGVTLMLQEGKTYILSGTVCVTEGDPASGPCCPGLEEVAADHAYSSCQKIGTPQGWWPGQCTEEGGTPYIDRKCCAGLDTVQDPATGQVTCKKAQ